MVSAGAKFGAFRPLRRDFTRLNVVDSAKSDRRRLNINAFVLSPGNIDPWSAKQGRAEEQQKNQNCIRLINAITKFSIFQTFISTEGFSKMRLIFEVKILDNETGNRINTVRNLNELHYAKIHLNFLILIGFLSQPLQWKPLNRLWRRWSAFPKWFRQSQQDPIRRPRSSSGANLSNFSGTYQVKINYSLTFVLRFEIKSYRFGTKFQENIQNINFETIVFKQV